MLIDEFRLPTEEGIDLVWSSPDLEGEEPGPGLQMIVMDLFPNADLNADGLVDAADVSIVQQNFGMTVPKGDLPSGDLDGDGLIDQDDLDTVQSQLGQTVFLDGIFGADLLTAGVEIDLGTFEMTGEPYFQNVFFDFCDWENGNGTMVLDLTECYYEGMIVPPLLGDTNADGRVDASDFVVLSENWQQSVTGGIVDGDFNVDGVVDGRDFAILSEHWQEGVVQEGDTNGDGRVDGSDFAVLSENWQQSVTGGIAEADFNEDGLVDGSDFAVLMSNWQAGVETASVPEPSTWILLLTFVTGLFLFRRVRKIKRLDTGG